MVTIATWNVNSVRTRLQHLLSWLREDAPDIVLLQEIKCVDEQFPRMEVEDLGYNVETHGQKSYNGVAILSKFPIEDVVRGLPENDEDEQSRYIEAITTTPCGLFRVASVYVPNGSTIEDEKYQYKLRFLEKFYTHMQTLLGYEEALVVGGDYNIAPTDMDVANPSQWKDSVLTHDNVRRAWHKIMNFGMYDADEHNHQLTWWDYRAGAFDRGDGLRIDHLLLSPQARDRLDKTEVIKKLRELEKPSDHAPVVGTFS